MMTGREEHPSVNDGPNFIGTPFSSSNPELASLQPYVQTLIDVFAAKYRAASLMSSFGPSLFAAISATTFGYRELFDRNLNHVVAGSGIWRFAILIMHPSV